MKNDGTEPLILLHQMQVWADFEWEIANQLRFCCEFLQSMKAVPTRTKSIGTILVRVTFIFLL